MFLDENSGWAFSPEVLKNLRKILSLEDLSPYAAHWNAIHSSGRSARDLVDSVRNEISTILPKNGKVFFSHSGSEAIDKIYKSFTWGFLESVFLWVDPFAHDSHLDLSYGVYSQLPLDDASFFESIREITSRSSSLNFLIWNWVHHETGIIRTPNREFWSKIQSETTWIHVDAAQAVNRISLKSIENESFDSMSFSGSKIGALSGVGVLWVRESSLKKLRNTSYLNKARVSSLALASLSWCLPGLQDRLNQIENLKKFTFEFEKKIALKKIQIIDSDAPRVPGVSFLHIPGVSGDQATLYLDMQNIQTSYGSACSSHALKASRYLLAKGWTEQKARQVLRLSYTMDIAPYEKLILEKIDDILSFA